VSEYRAFVIDADGYVTMQYELVCKTDAEALELAFVLVDAHDVEVWHRERVVGKLTPKQGSP
jgi:archaellin